MNRNLRRSVHAMLLGGLGAAIMAMPAGADTIGPWAIAMNTTIEPFGLSPNPGDSSAGYSSANLGGFPFNYAGLQTTLSDPTSSLNTSPASMPAGFQRRHVGP
jgi:hypothetical protein